MTRCSHSPRCCPNCCPDAAEHERFKETIDAVVRKVDRRGDVVLDDCADGEGSVVGREIAFLHDKPRPYVEEAVQHVKTALRRARG